MPHFRMKPNCVVGGVSWWKENGVYSGQDLAGGVRTVQLWSPNGADSVEVLRCSVVELNENPGGLT